MLKACCPLALLGAVFVAGGCCKEPCDPGVDRYHVQSDSDLAVIARCETISGDLMFERQSWLTSIDMPDLTSVGGGLWIVGNDALTSIDMPSITSVGGYLYIMSNESLSSIELPNLTSADRDLSISNNDALTSLANLPNLTSVGGYLSINHNDCLSQAEAEAFAATVTVGGSCKTHGNGVDYPCN